MGDEYCVRADRVKVAKMGIYKGSGCHRTEDQSPNIYTRTLTKKERKSSLEYVTKQNLVS